MVQTEECKITVQSNDYIAELSARLSKVYGFDIPKREHIILPKNIEEYKLLIREYDKEEERLKSLDCYNEATVSHLLYVLDTLWHQTRWYAIDNLGAGYGTHYEDNN